MLWTLLTMVRQSEAGSQTQLSCAPDMRRMLLADLHISSVARGTGARL
jgi:hypothetical protein